MKKATPAGRKQSEKGLAFSKLVKEALGIYVQLVLVGDKLSADFGLSSARWQVIGAIQDTSKSVSDIARERGLARQSVQRIVNALKRQGYVRLTDNPRHQRAKLVALTEKGRKALNGVAARQTQWADQLSQSFQRREMDVAAAVLNRLRTLL